MKKLFCVFLLLLFTTFSKNAFADSNFSTDYDVSYFVNNNASTRVSMSGILTNLSDKYYASSYTVRVGFSDIKNVRAYDLNGDITPKISNSTDGNSITLNFNNPATGLNKKFSFNISFDTNEVAQNRNNTWDINIPGIASQNDFSSFNVNVSYPNFLGKPTFIKPLLPEQSASGSGNQIFFTKNDLGSSGISIAFGSFQNYDFNLKYHLENANLFPVTTEIALPPTTNYQDISINDIYPKPSNVRIDKDGNWLAQYILPSSKKITVNVKGNAKVYIKPFAQPLDKGLLNDYLKPQQYWEVNYQKIQTLAKKLQTPYAIYRYVSQTLHYDFSRIETNSPRLGGVGALDNPNTAVCLEFTDLFITLTRAAGIPAREVDGYGYSNNVRERPLSLVKDILHAWPEYYDFEKKTWVMIDPTWGNTTGGVDYFNTLDFDHITFVIRGENSMYPVPAGGYKLTQDTQTKDIDIKIGTNFNNKQNLKSELLINSPLIAGLPIRADIKISNLGTTLIKRQTITVSTNYINPRRQVFNINDIPPFGYELIPVYFDKTYFLTNTQDTVKITIGNHFTYKKIEIFPFFVNKLFLFGGLIFASIIIALSGFTYIFRRISFFRQKG